jgi:hypothetical protein
LIIPRPHFANSAQKVKIIVFDLGLKISNSKLNAG